MIYDFFSVMATLPVILAIVSMFIHSTLQSQFQKEGKSILFCKHMKLSVKCEVTEPLYFGIHTPNMA